MPVQLSGWEGFDRALRRLRPPEHDPLINVSLRDAGFVTPGGLAHLFAIAFTLKHSGYELSFLPPLNTDVERYLQRTEFWRRLCENGVNVDAQWSGTTNSIAPGLLEFREIQTSGSTQDNNRKAEALNARFAQMIRAEGLEQTYASQIWTELCQNAAEHSLAQIPAFVCAQRYGEKVEIGIVDVGRGILEATKHLGFKTESEAIGAVLNDGVTGRPSGEGGTGLYTAREVAKSLLIRSGDGLWESNGSRSAGVLNMDESVCFGMKGTLLIAVAEA